MHEFLDHVRLFPLRTTEAAKPARALCPKQSHRRRYLAPANALRKLALSDVLAIRRYALERPDMGAWAQARILAPRYGVTTSTVHEVICRRTWVRLPPEQRRWVSQPSRCDRWVLWLMLILWFVQRPQQATASRVAIAVG